MNQLTLRSAIFGLLAILLMSLSLSTALAAPKPVEGRGIWIDANSIPADDQAMAAFVDSFAQANLNVLIPETLRRGYTIYPSKLNVQDPKWKGYDPLAALIREAHKRGMEVHPWVWVFRQGYSQDKGPILTAHPEWTAVNKWGETLSANGGYWVCPSIPKARDYLVSVFNEIVTNYDVDGLHLDYVRYENQFPAPYCYNASCRDKFKAAHGVDPIEIDPLTEMQVTWHLWREGLVNSFVQQVAAETRRLKPEVKISAAVGSFPDRARESLLQNWPNWVDNKWVDFLTPMAYTANMKTFGDMVQAEKDTVGTKSIIMPGLGLHTHKSVEPTLEQVDVSRDANTDGVTMFAAIYLKDPLRQALASGPFPNKAEIPFRRPMDRVKTLLNAAKGTMATRPGEASSYLNDASRLLGYLAYQATDVGHVKPTRPPIYIPEVVMPIGTADVPRVTSPPTIDGKLAEAIWSQGGQINISYTDMGNPAPVETEVRLAYSEKSLYIAYIAEESVMGKLKETVSSRDGPTFYDDSVELFLDPWGKRREYFQISANTLGAQYDAKLNNPGVNPEWQVAVTKQENGWTAEIAIPFASLGVEPPKPGESWNANFARNRWVTGEAQFLAWSVPYGGFHRPERFGTLLFK